MSVFHMVKKKPRYFYRNIQKILENSWIKFMFSTLSCSQYQFVIIPQRVGIENWDRHIGKKTKNHLLKSQDSSQVPGGGKAGNKYFIIFLQVYRKTWTRSRGKTLPFFGSQLKMNISCFSDEESAASRSLYVSSKKLCVCFGEECCNSSALPFPSGVWNGNGVLKASQTLTLEQRQGLLPGNLRSQKKNCLLTWLLIVIQKPQNQKLPCHVPSNFCEKTQLLCTRLSSGVKETLKQYRQNITK